MNQHQKGSFKCRIIIRLRRMYEMQTIVTEGAQETMYWFLSPTARGGRLNAVFVKLLWPLVSFRKVKGSCCYLTNRVVCHLCLVMFLSCSTKIAYVNVIELPS